MGPTLVQDGQSLSPCAWPGQPHWLQLTVFMTYVKLSIAAACVVELDLAQVI
jgi:hypothetical protein